MPKSIPLPIADSPGSNRPDRAGIRDFLLILFGMVVLRLLIGWVSVPAALIIPSSLIISVIFVSAPIFALFRAASEVWTAKRAFTFLALGVLVYAGGMIGAAGSTRPILIGLATALSQQGLVTWCLAIGALISLLLKDKNLLLPIAIFLALFDMWLVFAPEGVVNQTVVQGPATLLQKGGYTIPAPQTVSAGGKATPLAFVGPADYLFLAMFFVALFRFKMRTRETFLAAMPVLAGYLLVVLCFNAVQIGPIRLGALPALLPIGICVLVVNRKEFHLSKEELKSTIALAVIGTAVVTWRIMAPRPTPSPQAELSRSASDPATQEPEVKLE